MTETDMQNLNFLTINELYQLGSEFGIKLAKNLTKKQIINKFLDCDNLEPKLKYINNTSGFGGRNNKLVDHLRFNCDVWPVPNSSYDESEMFFMQIYVKLTDNQKKIYENMLGTSMKTMLKSLALNLKKHTDMLLNNATLIELVGKHAGSPLTMETNDGRKFNYLLMKSIIISPIITFRTLINDYRPKLVVGNKYKTDKIWSTSYDPLSSIGFGYGEDFKYIYILKIFLPKNTRGALFIENNPENVVKEQHEITIAAGLPFYVNRIQENVDIQYFDEVENVKTVKATIYDISMC